MGRRARPDHAALRHCGDRCRGALAPPAPAAVLWRGALAPTAPAAVPCGTAGPCRGALWYCRRLPCALGTACRCRGHLQRCRRAAPARHKGVPDASTMIEYPFCV